MVFTISESSSLQPQLHTFSYDSLSPSRENVTGLTENESSTPCTNRGNSTQETDSQSTPCQEGATDIVHVCKSCQHLYDGNRTVVLTPNSLSRVPSSPTSRKQVKPWGARKYEDLCVCAETGGVCRCAASKSSKWQRLLPRNAPWWPRVKVILLTVAGLTPWACLVLYFVFYYRT